MVMGDISNVLTGIAGIYIETFVRLPVARKLCAPLGPEIDRKPLSSVKDAIIQVAPKITFIAPAAVLDAFAETSLGKDLKNFVRIGWKMVVITLLATAGTFMFFTFAADQVLRTTGAIRAAWVQNRNMLCYDTKEGVIWNGKM